MSRLREEIHQSGPFASSEEEVFLNIQRSAHLLTRSFATVLKGDGLTPGQYNVLRILRGSEPEALTCGEIAERLVTPGPDVPASRSNDGSSTPVPGMRQSRAGRRPRG